MNIVDQIQVNYLRANRTIETILLTDTICSNKQKVVYIYNYEGYHYRIFENVIELSNFLNDDRYEILKEYSTDTGVYNYLGDLEFST
jgi:hypothetical protein